MKQNKAVKERNNILRQMNNIPEKKLYFAFKTDAHNTVSFVR